MNIQEINIKDIYAISDNTIYIVRSRYEVDTTMKFVDWLNKAARKAELTTRFVYLPEGLTLEPIKK